MSSSSRALVDATLSPIQIIRFKEPDQFSSCCFICDRENNSNCNFISLSVQLSLSQTADPVSGYLHRLFAYIITLGKTKDYVCILERRLHLCCAIYLEYFLAVFTLFSYLIANRSVQD